MGREEVEVKRGDLVLSETRLLHKKEELMVISFGGGLNRWAVTGPNPYFCLRKI